MIAHSGSIRRPRPRSLAIQVTQAGLQRQRSEPGPGPVAIAPSGGSAGGGEHHRRAGRVDGVHDLVVADRAARLDDRGRAGIERRAAARRRTGSRRRRRAPTRRVEDAGLFDRQAHRVDAAHLARPDPHRRTDPRTRTIAFERTCLQTFHANCELTPLGLGRARARRRPACRSAPRGRSRGPGRACRRRPGAAPARSGRGCAARGRRGSACCAWSSRISSASSS